MLTLCRQLKRLSSTRLASASTSGSALVNISWRLPVLLESFSCSVPAFVNGIPVDQSQHAVLPWYEVLYLAASMLNIKSGRNLEEHEEKQSFDSFNGTTIRNHSNSNGFGVAMDSVRLSGDQNDSGKNGNQETRKKRKKKRNRKKRNHSSHGTDCSREIIHDPIKRTAPDSKLISLHDATQLNEYVNYSNATEAEFRDSDPEEHIVFKGMCSTHNDVKQLNRFVNCNNGIGVECGDALNVDPSTCVYDHFKENKGLQNQIQGVMIETEKKSGVGGIQIYRSLPICNDTYIILDLNGVLIKRWDKNPSLPGVRKFAKKWVQLRPGCIEFLKKSCAFFKVGIWSTMMPENAKSVWKYLEQEAQQSLPFFMVWGKDLCYQQKGIHRPDKANVPADFKPLSKVWSHFHPNLNFHNTVLVDDSPYKACMNSPCNCIFPDPFNGSTDDNFLNENLWPYLEKMRFFPDVPTYVASNRLGQQPISVRHELYYHVRPVMQKFWIDFPHLITETSTTS